MTTQIDTLTAGATEIAGLVRTGDLPAAVSQLHQAGHPQPHAAVGRLWAQQRAQAFANSADAPLPSWPPVAGSTLAPTGTIPEISRDELTTQTLTDGVIGSGSLIVRGLVDPDQAADLCGTVDSVMQAREAVKAGDDRVGNVAWYDRYDPAMNTFAGDSAAYVLDSPIATYQVSNLYHSLGLPGIIGSYLGEPPAVSLRKWVLRRVPHDANSGWHQDGAFLGRDTRNMNLWISLTDSGVDAPGIDLVPFRLNDLVESGTEDAHFDWSVGASVVQQLVGDHGIARPQFKAGDALFFDHFCLHATGVTPQMTKTRYAIESWFFAPSHFPKDYTGFLL